MDLQTLLPIIVVALLTLAGNVSYFEYKFRKEAGKSILRERLTNFLLPIYFLLKKDELEVHTWLKSDVDHYEYESDMPERLMSSELYEIISKNLHLADDELHSACLQFLEWGYKSDSNERFQRVHNGTLPEDVTFKHFRELVYTKFSQARRRYLEIQADPIVE